MARAKVLSVDRRGVTNLLLRLQQVIEDYEESLPDDVKVVVDIVSNSILLHLDGGDSLAPHLARLEALQNEGED